MQSSSTLLNSLPLLVASSRCASWVDVLQTYQKTCELLRGIYQPTTEELNSGLSRMETSRGISNFYYDIIKETCGYTEPHTCLVRTALLKFKNCGNFYAIKRIMDEDVDISTHQGARSALMYASFTGMWEHALNLYKSNKRLQESSTDTRVLINILCHHGLWNEALKVVYSPSPPLLGPLFIKPILRSMGLSGEYQKLFQLLAASLAQGYLLDDAIFSGVVKSLQKTGQWKSALDTALELGLLSSSRESTTRQITLYASLVDCLYSVDPYSQFTLHDIVSDITYRMSPRKMHVRSTNRSEKTVRLLSTSEMFRLYRRYVSPLSYFYTNILGFGAVQSRPVSKVADEVFKQGDALLVLDTNFVIQCVAKNIPIHHFFPPMRKKYPHLENKPLQHILLPFTTVREIHQLIWSPTTKLKRAVRALLWSRVIAFVKQPSVTVLALSAEFPCTSFSIVSRLAYSRLNEPFSTEDPDIRILNTCVALQYTLRQRSATSYHGATLMAEGTMLFSFLKYHVRRHGGDVKGISSEQLVLCTMDKRLSAAADELGIQTFPQYNEPHESLAEIEIIK